MNARSLYFIAAALALVAACIHFFRSAPGDYVGMTTALLVVLGAVLFALGMRRSGSGPG